MALSDDVAELVAFQVHFLVSSGIAERMRRAGFGADTGKLAKLVGATPAQVFCWERGELEPSTSQGIAWLRALRSHQPRLVRNPWAPKEDEPASETNDVGVPG